MEKLAIFGGLKVNEKIFPVWPQYNAEDEKLLLSALHSGNWSATSNSGKGKETDKGFIEKFEDEISRILNTQYVLAVTNGTNALEIATQAIGISPGDEVIVSPYSFISSATCILKAGAAPIFADIDYDTWNIDPVMIEKCITKRTRAIIPVHFGGQPCDMDKIVAIAKKYNIKIIEDAAQALGASWKSKPVGSIGNFGCFSMQSSKNLTCGEGGIVITNEEDYYKKLYSLYNLGRSLGGLWYEHNILGSNYRITELQAALAYSQLSRLEAQNRIRYDNAKYLDGMLNQIEGIETRKIQDGVTYPVYNLYCFRYKSELWNGLTRKRFIMLLNSEGIPCNGGYITPIYQNKPFQESYNNEANRRITTEISELTCKEAVWFQSNVLLADKKQIQKIVEAILKIRQNLSRLTR